jgi:hypothetical protein
MVAEAVIGQGMAMTMQARSNWLGKPAAAPAAKRQRVVDEILPLIPAAEEAALGHAQIWRLANRWSQNAVRLALIELDQRGMINSRIVRARNGVPKRLYWVKPGGQ